MQIAALALKLKTQHQQGRRSFLICSDAESANKNDVKSENKLQTLQGLVTGKHMVDRNSILLKQDRMPYESYADLI